jgi:hypothetical protein
MGGVAKVGEFIKQVKDKNSGVKLMGFGHRVYKNYDPRAKLMQETCNEVLAELGLENDPLFKLAMALEKIALEDDYFVQRKLYPNVDFYSGIVQRAIGIPVNLFTGIFALARTVGWIAQLNEMIGDPEYKIGRPRQLFRGPSRQCGQLDARSQARSCAGAMWRWWGSSANGSGSVSGNPWASVSAKPSARVGAKSRSPRPPTIWRSQPVRSELRALSAWPWAGALNFCDIFSLLWGIQTVGNGLFESTEGVSRVDRAWCEDWRVSTVPQGSPKPTGANFTPPRSGDQCANLTR